MIDLRHIDTWVFDLDNTLYHPRHDLFKQIDVRMGAYIQRLLNVDAVEARRVQKTYFRDHGTTLRGLMAHYEIDPHHFLDDVHDIDVTIVPPDAALNDVLHNLPGRKLIFTNGDTPYARRVLNRIGIEAHFTGIQCIIGQKFVPKPDPLVYTQFTNEFAIDPARTIFFEDMARNLAPAKKLGWTTVWMNNGSEWGDTGSGDGHIDFETDDLASWLNQVGN
jgi:putative hydrolase of the HAD superfamily